MKGVIEPMNKIGRNDECPCGSGIKYKSCCLAKSEKDSFEEWKTNSELLLRDITEKEKITAIYFKLLNIIKKTDWQGGCHAISSIMYILFKEIGLNAVLCLGEVKYKNVVFDHSWVEVDNKIYDVAILNSLDNIKLYEPIINGFNISTKEKSEAIYGGAANQAQDYYANTVMKISIVDYMDGFPLKLLFDKKMIDDIKNSYDFSVEGLWGFVIKTGKLVQLNLNVEQLKNKYKNAVRIQK